MRAADSKSRKPGNGMGRLFYVAVVLAATVKIHAAVPLAANNGETNHPVLFVHGAGAHMTFEWGALPTTETGGGCNLGENPQVTWEIAKNISHNKTWYGTNQYKHGLLVKAFLQDCGGVNHQILPPKTSDPAISLGRRAWIGCSSEIWWGVSDDCAQPLRNNSVTSTTGTGINTVFRLDGVGSNFSGFSKTYTLNEDQKRRLQLAIDDFVRENSSGVILDDESVAYPVASEGQLDRPVGYLPSSTPRRIQAALGLNAPPLDNGLYFFNAKQMVGSLVAVNPNHPVQWTSMVGGRPGQAAQLYGRIVQVMNAYYGPKGIDWRASSAATIDLVGYSQGGLTIRAMVDWLVNHPNDLDADSRPLREVLNRINRIVASNTPHLGSAMITDPGRLTNGINHPQSPVPLRFPVLGREILNLTENDPGFPILEVHDDDLIDIDWWDNASLDLVIDGDSYLGPYTQTEGEASLFFCAENCRWWECFPTGVLNCWLTLKFPFDLSEMWSKLSVETGKVRDKINIKRRGARHLSWSDAAPGGVPTGALIRDALQYGFPRNSSGVNIEMVSLHSRSSGALMTALPDRIQQELHPICKEMMRSGNVPIDDAVLQKINVTTTCARLADRVSRGLALRHFSEEFDADWSTRGDFVVEDFSQAGVLEGSDYDPQVNSQMKPRAFSRPELIHWNIPFLGDHPDLIAHNQGCDYLAALGAGCAPPPPAPPVAAEQAAFSLAPERLDRVETKAVTGRGSAAYKVRLRYVRNAPGTLDHLALTYFFKEDPENAPAVAVTAGGWTAHVRQVDGSLQAVDLTATGMDLDPGETSPEVELTFSNGSGAFWNPVDDWSSSLVPVWEPTRRVAYSARNGENIGLLPEATDAENTTFTHVAKAYSKERSLDATQSQPYISVENRGSGVINGFRIWYVVRAPSSFQVREYYRTGQSRSSVSTRALGNGYSAVEVDYPDWSLSPGQSIEEITFELNHLDWSAWNKSDDPSYHTANPQALEANPRIMVFDRDGNLIGGEDLSALWETGGGDPSAHAEAKNSSTYPDYKVLDFRVRNDGPVPMYGAEIRYRMITENGAAPQVHFVNAQGCQTRVVDFDDGRYEARIKCPAAAIEPGQAWPQPGAGQGLRMEIQYGGGAAVNLADDPSFTGIGSDWAAAPGVLLLDSECDPISGQAPWDGVPVPQLPSPWTSQDIGAVGIQGSATHASGSFAVAASGGDIWNGADAFRFVYVPLTGDVEVKARVTAIQNTHAWAKGGVMIRESLDPGARHAMVNVTGSSGVQFMRRSASGGTTASTGATGSAPKWVKLTRQGGTLSAYVSDNGTAWTLVGSQALALGTSVYAGLAVTSHDNAALCQAAFDNVSATATPANPWTKSDIGSVGVAGSTTVTAASGSVTGSGIDIWDAADAFTFVHRPLSGDGSITARVTGVQNTNAWAKAGVMIRESLAAGSPHAFLAATPGNGLAFQRRVAANGSSASTGASGAAPAWVRLSRIGNTITALTSPDGSNWTQVGTATVPMATDIHIGLAVTSHNNPVAATASFTDIQVVE